MKTLRNISIKTGRYYVAISRKDQGRGFCFGFGQRPSIEEITP